MERAGGNGVQIENVVSISNPLNLKSMRKEFKILIAIAVFVIFGTAAYYLYSVRQKENTQINQPGQPVNTNNFSSSVQQNTQKSTFSVPEKSADKMTIKTTQGDIATNNLYKNPVELFSDNTVFFIENTDYHISFNPHDQSFLITLLNPDIQTTRNRAEDDFLNALNITKNDACKLTLILGMPAFVNENLSGKNYGLSFCPNGKPFPKQ
jgi:hypothetical protein